MTDSATSSVSLLTLLVSVVVLLGAASPAQAQRTIADYQDDYQVPDPAAGWSYLWNQPDVYAELDFSSPGQWNSNGHEVDGTKIADPDSDIDGSDSDSTNNYIANVYANDNTVGDTTNYTALQAFTGGGRELYTAVGQWPFDGRLQAAANMYFKPTEAIPGHAAGSGPTDAYDSEVGDGDPYDNQLDRYLIAAYTVQPEEEGMLRIDSSMVGDKSPGTGDGIVVRVFVENTEIGQPDTISGTDDFDRDLGAVFAGETVYVAFGPNESQAGDLFNLDYSIDRTGAIPVELAGFTARTDGREAILEWKTLTETSNSGFLIERSRNEVDGWSEAGFVASKAKGGSSQEPHRYQFRLNDLEYGTHTFRLVQRDLDGSSEVVGKQSVEIRPSSAYTLSPASPNPFSERTTIGFTVREQQDVRVELFNVLGQRVRMLWKGSATASERQVVNLRSDDLSSGVYVIRITGENFTASRKVTLLR